MKSAGERAGGLGEDRALNQGISRAGSLKSNVHEFAGGRQQLSMNEGEPCRSVR